MLQIKVLTANMWEEYKIANNDNIPKFVRLYLALYSRMVIFYFLIFQSRNYRLLSTAQNL